MVGKLSLREKLKTTILACLLIVLHLTVWLSLLWYLYVMMHGWRATLYAVMLQLFLVQCHKCVEGKPKIWPNWLEHDNCYIPMAVRHSVDLVRPYRIFKAIDKEPSDYREKVEVVRVQWSISQIIHLKQIFDSWKSKATPESCLARSGPNLILEFR